MTSELVCEGGRECVSSQCAYQQNRFLSFLFYFLGRKIRRPKAVVIVVKLLKTMLSLLSVFDFEIHNTTTTKSCPSQHKEVSQPSVLPTTTTAAAMTAKRRNRFNNDYAETREIWKRNSRLSCDSREFDRQWSRPRDECYAYNFGNDIVHSPLYFSFSRFPALDPSLFFQCCFFHPSLSHTVDLALSFSPPHLRESRRTRIT